MLPKTKSRLLFGSALGLLCVSGVATFVAMSHLQAAQEWVSHTREVQVALSEVNTIVSRAGRTRTEFVDSGDLNRLRDHQLALAEIPATLTLLKHLISDNPPQQKRVAELEKLVEQRVGLMRQSVALKQTGHSTLENQSRITKSIVSVASQMDGLIQQMQDQEQSLLELRIDRWRKGERLAAILLWSAFLIAGMFLIFHYRLLRRELHGRERAEASLRKLSARILQIQDDERRKFSRELHDSLGQYLAGAKMNLDSLAHTLPDNTVIADCSDLLEHAIKETRTISHLLHPPLLDEAGFASAARWYVEGFSKRSGIQTKLNISEPFDRLSPAVELAMFRVLQESLTNIHRHSRSSTSDIAVARGPRNVSLTIRDNGGGISSALLQRISTDGVHVGVGLAGMRERVRELGGRLEIHSDTTGTLVTAILPTPPEAP
jgi:signal transduction histidine kinase